VEGVAQVDLKLNKAGAQAVMFSQAGVTSPAAMALNIAPVAGSTATMKLTTGVSAPQANGGSFAQQPVITLLDQFGNVNIGDNSSVVTVSKKDAGSWTLTGNTTLTAVAGVISFTDLGATNAAGITGAQLAFDATGLTQITSVALNLPEPQGAQSITASAATLTPVVGVNNGITLTVKNSLGNTDTTFTGTKEVTVSGYDVAPDGTYGSLGSTALAASPSKINVDFVEGVAQVDLKLNKAGAQAVMCSAGQRRQLRAAASDNAAGPVWECKHWRQQYGCYCVEEGCRKLDVDGECDVDGSSGCHYLYGSGSYECSWNHRSPTGI
ncbi:hypothetical protein BSK63_31465, partial [Paenibacillus odorifer]